MGEASCTLRSRLGLLLLLPALLLLPILLFSSLARADEPTVTVTVGQQTRNFTRGELLARPDATTTRRHATSAIVRR